MATTNNNRVLVDLNILNYYDANMKKWIVNKIAENTQLVFEEEGSFPPIGQSGILYISPISIYLWDDINKKYSSLITSSIPQWGIF